MREIIYQINDWKPAIFIASKGQTNADVLRILAAKYRSVTIRILSRHAYAHLSRNPIRHRRRCAVAGRDSHVC